MRQSTFVPLRNLRLLGCLIGWQAAFSGLIAPCLAAPPVEVDLSKYLIQGRYDLPVPEGSPSAGERLALEASAIAYNGDTDTLFVVGDGGTAVVQVSKTGQLIDFMTLESAAGPAGATFQDTEGLAYIGDGRFVLIEERERRVNQFTYVAGTTLHRADVQSVKLGTTVGNIGLEGASWDPVTAGFILVKEKDPASIFGTLIDFEAGTASNGSSSQAGSTDLFNPTLATLADFSDVFALGNIPSLLGGPDADHLLVVSQESGQVVEVDRGGVVQGRLTITAPIGASLSVAEMSMEGLTMDKEGRLYVVNENGGGAGHPQVWVYAPSDALNQAPTGLRFAHAIDVIPENTSLARALKIADLVVDDDGLGDNRLTLDGPDAGVFEVIGSALYLRSGTTLDSGLQPAYVVTVHVDDPAVGSLPDASAVFELRVAPPLVGTASVIVSEVAPWSSGLSPVVLGADWFEVSNVGTASQDISGWRFDDSSGLFGSSLALNGVSSIAPGESVIFVEIPDPSPATVAGKIAGFIAVWFGGTAPPGLQIGTYSGPGVGLGAGGDAVNLFDAGGALQASVRFGASPAGPSLPTFDNAEGLDGVPITRLSVAGVRGAFAALGDPNEIGSPGTVGDSERPVVSVVAIDEDAAESGADPGVLRIVRSGSVAESLTVSYAIAVGPGWADAADFSAPLGGSVTILPGQSFAELTLLPVEDAVLEGEERLKLTLIEMAGYEVGAAASAEIRIASDLEAPHAEPGIVSARGGFYLDRRTGLFMQRHTLVNATAVPIEGPIYLVIDGLTAGTSLSGATGTTAQVPPLGSPFMMVLGPGETLGPAASTSLTLGFVNPARRSFTYQTRVLSGGNSSP